MTVTLDTAEQATLFKQDPSTKGNGGFQKLLVDLQTKFNHATSTLFLTPLDLEKIPRYAFDYKNGGWENRLKAIFEKHLGPNLGR